MLAMFAMCLMKISSLSVVKLSSLKFYTASILKSLIDEYEGVPFILLEMNMQ
jgi:hypothetical protein